MKRQAAEKIASYMENRQQVLFLFCIYGNSSHWCVEAAHSICRPCEEILSLPSEDIMEFNPRFKLPFYKGKGKMGQSETQDSS